MAVVTISTSAYAACPRAFFHSQLSQLDSKSDNAYLACSALEPGLWRGLHAAVPAPAAHCRINKPNGAHNRSVQCPLVGLEMVCMQGGLHLFPGMRRLRLYRRSPQQHLPRHPLQVTP